MELHLTATECHLIYGMIGYAKLSAVLAIENPSVRRSVRPSVRPSVTRWHCVKTTQAAIMGSSL